jgi:hypothetical protein
MSSSNYQSNSQTFYINSVTGSDSNSGHSPQKAWATFSNIKNETFKPGDKILLACGSKFNQSLILEKCTGTPENPITVSNYQVDGIEEIPLIDAYGFANGILIRNSSHIKISGIKITGDGGGVKNSDNAQQNMRCGVLVTVSEAGQFENISLENLKIHDVFFEENGFQRGTEEVRTSNGEQSYGWGIRVINQRKDAIIKNILLENCEVKSIAHTGIKFTGNNKNIQDIKLHKTRVSHSGGPGIQMSGVKNAHISFNEVQFSGSNNDTRKWGRGSGFWCWGSSDVVIEHNSFRKANGPGDSAGCHIDFNCNNVVVQYNLSEGNAGGFCEILGNNYNCSYRYNISINDGHRIKGENGAFQEGKIFWLSAYTGNKNPRTGPFNSYFYNNTIYVSKNIVANIAVGQASSGVLIANNIFYIEGESQAVKGDQYKPETEGESRMENIVFKNNLYLKTNNWPEKVFIQDSQPIYGNPKYKNPGGTRAEDYIPQNSELIKDKGINIMNIPGDEIGLTVGLKVIKDFFGNPVQNLPDIGAIEIQ